MSSEVMFGNLVDVPLRDAWAHEAHRFTPWLADNLQHLSNAVGIPLELTGTEIRVGTFSADILARNPADDSIVLIENQLEGSDHGHLGQIMTYLAGLETHTMIWVAPSFREEHLSAIRWLNEHTVDPFAFFAVRVRVVQIAGSPFAPLFEVIERPNNWDRKIAETKRSAEGNLSALGQHRLEFWTHFCARYPSYGQPTAASSRSVSLAGTSAILVLYVARDEVGVFVRPKRGSSAEVLEDELTPSFARLAEELHVKPGGQYSFHSWSEKTDARNSANWDSLADWLNSKAHAYQAAFASVTRETSEGSV